MLCLLDIVALSAWPRAALEPFSTQLKLLLGDAPPGTDPAPSDLAATLELAGVLGADATASQLREKAAIWLDRASRLGVEVLPWGDTRYPALLAAIPAAPLVLWLQGKVDSLRGQCVAIVGSRVASACGIEAATNLAADLLLAGMVIVSGLARGVDSAAHLGTLGVSGVTVAVLGSGLDSIYPPEHKRLAREIVERGAVVSEYPPGTPPLPRNFPARNRIISGLSLGVVVIEAAEASGSLITAGCALEQGRHVMAVPGNVLSGRYRGSHALLRDGAAVVEGAQDVLSELASGSLQSVSRPVPIPFDEGDPLLAAMGPGEARDVDSLSRETGLQPAALLPRLLDLELRGAVRRVAGGRFLRAGRTC